MDKRKIVFLCWGVLDVIYVLWYSFGSIQRGSIPFYTDLLSMIEVLSVHGGVVTCIFAILFWLLQVSIIASAIMLLIGHAKAKLLCYIQIPFRLVSIVPSICLITIVFSYVDQRSALLAIALVVLSEIIKGYTLRKYVD